MLPSKVVLRSPALTDEEKELVGGLKARSDEAWARLYSTYYERLRRYVVGRGLWRDEAEDIVSLVYLRALNRIDSYHYSGKPVVAWLYGILQNLIREQMRANKGNRVQSIGEEDACQLLTHRDPDVSQRLDLEAAISTLSSKQREVVALLHFGGFSAKEVASVLGKNERSIYYLEARALLHLRTELEAREEDA